MKVEGTEQFRFEPTVFGAVRRYRAMVLAIACLTMIAAVAYSLLVIDVYRAEARVTIPRSSSESQESAQYLDSQVLLLRSPEVAQRAAMIANAELGGDVLTKDDFSGPESSLTITPPASSSPGTHGSHTIAVSFTWPSPGPAQAGANAVLQALDEAHSAAIKAQGDATIARIDRAIADPNNRMQRAELLSQRAQALVNQQVDLARHPTIAWATEPVTPINGNSKLAGATGLLGGVLLGAGVAFARASRRGGFDNALAPAGFYGVPPIGEVRTTERWNLRAARRSPVDPLPMTSDPRSAAAEAFRLVASSVERIRAPEGPGQSIAFVSPVAGAGTGLVVANLALAFAEHGQRVLAVDADPGRGDLTSLLLPGHPSDRESEWVLAGPPVAADRITTSPLNASVAVLGTGPDVPQRPEDTAYSKALEKLIADVKGHYDIILVGGPPLLEIADAGSLLAVTDATVIVLSSRERTRDHLTMRNRLALIGPRLLGYVWVRVQGQLRRGPSRRSDHDTRIPDMPSSPESSHVLQASSHGSGRPEPATRTRR
ncbi:AAA family ATPase [Pseudonocardia hispaniensis]|uniref:AAA family ATPase n=1 Tax=Pseudonocardia hispaniensis TaxID=904933 RepID=A0ABW1IYW7_9PSEU